MLKPEARTNRKAAAAWTGGAAILVAGLNYAQNQLGAFNLDKVPLTVVSGAIIVAGLAIAQFSTIRARNAAADDLEAKLDSALSCWPPRQRGALEPADVGVRPALQGSQPYLERDADGRLAEAWRRSDIVVVFGPPGAGKSRSAYELTPKGAYMVMPEDADGLATLLRSWPSLRFDEDDEAVVWLDDFDRYAAKLDTDPMLALLGRPSSRGRVKVVATIREDVLSRLLDGDEPAGHRVRRFMAHGEGVRLGDELSAEERERFHAAHGKAPEGRTVAETFASLWRGGWGRSERPPPPALAWRRSWLDVPLIGLGVLFAVAIAWLAWHHGELTVAPPMDKQVAALADRAACPLDAYPADGKGLKESDGNRDVLVTVEHGGDCGVSDRVRFYRVRNDRLQELTGIAAAPSMARHTFACTGPGTGGDPCHVTLAGNRSFIVGAFEDAQTHQELPVAISFEDGGLRVWSLQLPAGRLSRVLSSIRRLDAKPVTLRLAVGHAAGLPDGPCREGLDCSRGRRAQITAIVPAGRDHGPLLLAGYTTAGTNDSPDSVLVRAWHLGVTAAGRPEADRDCVLLRDGLVVDKPIAFGAGALVDRWRRKDAQIMC